MVSITANAMFIAFVYARSTKNPVIRSCLLYMIIVETWLFTHLFYWAASPLEPWTTWAFRILSITWLPDGLFYLEFVYIFSQNLNPKSRFLLRSNYTFLLEILLWFFRIGIPILYLITLSTDWIIHGIVHHYWGNANEPSPTYYLVILIFILLPSFIGLGILIKSFLVSEGEQKKQIGLILFGSTFSILVSFYYEVIQIDDQGKLLSPPLTSIGVLVRSFLIFIAITRYGFLKINVEGLATELFRDIHDGMILIKRDRSLFFINESAIKILGISNFIPSHFFLPIF